MRRPIMQLEELEWKRSLKWIRIRAATTFVFFFLGFLCIAVRSFHLQLGDDARLERLAENQYQKRIALSPERGTIFDRNGHELAVDSQVYSIFAHPHLIPEAKRNTVATALANILKQNHGKLLAKLKSGKSFIWVSRRISPEDKTRIEDAKLPGVFSVPEKKRYYPNGPLAGQLLGAVGYDAEALGGLELTYDSHLKSRKDNYLIEKDAKGRSYLYIEEAKKELSDLHLSIDRNIQYIVERELAQTVATFNPLHGFVLVSRPATGEILAVANAPAFDPNHYGRHDISLWRNHAFTDVFEPGSTFKAVTVAAALQSGAVTPDDVFFCENGRWPIANRRIHDHHGYGNLSVRDIVKVSSNIGTAKIEQKAGRTAFAGMIGALGFGKRSLLAYPGESAGMLQDSKRWGPVEESNIAFGQGIAVSGLQMLQAYGAFANGGWLMKPILIQAITDRTGKVVVRHDPEPMRQVLSKKNSEMLTEMLEGVVQKGGTATTAALENFQVAGKTGTAQKVADGGYVKGKYTASFIGYVPAEKPELLIYAVLDEPKPQYYGGLVAGPLFRRIADQSLNHLGIMGDTKPTDPLVAHPSPPIPGAIPGKTLTPTTPLAVAMPPEAPSGHSDETSLTPPEPKEDIQATLKKGVAPDLTGLSLRQVLTHFNQAPYTLESEGIGFVVKQTPEPGSTLKAGERVHIVLSPHRG